MSAGAVLGGAVAGANTGYNGISKRDLAILSTQIMASVFRKMVEKTSIPVFFFNPDGCQSTIWSCIFFFKTKYPSIRSVPESRWPPVDDGPLLPPLLVRKRSLRAESRLRPPGWAAQRGAHLHREGPDGSGEVVCYSTITAMCAVTEVKTG